MSFLRKLFKRQANDTPATPPQGTSMEGRLAEVSSVLTALGSYYQAHAMPNNEILVKVAMTLSAYQLALTRVLSRPTLGELELREVAGFLAPSDADQAAKIRAAAPLLNDMLPGDRDRVRNDVLHELMTGINMYADVGRKLLQVRMWRDQGMSEKKIERLLDTWQIKNIF